MLRTETADVRLTPGERRLVDRLVVELRGRGLRPRRLWLFGSRRRGAADEASDLDLAVELAGAADAGRRAEAALLGVELAARTGLPLELLVIFEEDAATPFRETLGREGVLLWQEREGMPSSPRADGGASSNG